MDKKSIGTTFLGRVMTSLGGYFIVAVVFVAQLVPNLVVIPIAFFIQANAEFTKIQFSRACTFGALSLLAGNLFLLIWTQLSNRQARQRITQSVRAEQYQTEGPDIEYEGWTQITSFAWRYAIASGLASVIVFLLPLLGYLSLVLKATTNQLIYTGAGGIVSISVIVALGILMIERMLVPARVALLPSDFDKQLSGSSGARMLTKFQGIIFIMILVCVLLIGPVGYHSTLSVLISGLIGPEGALRTLQYQLIFAGVVAIAIGSGLSLLLSRSVSDPIRQMILIFDKVEKGDLKQRTSVTATDEVGELAVHFNRMIARLDELQGSLEKTVAERTEQLEATIEVSNVASTSLDPDELISRVVNLITDRFGYYYTAIFLIDPTGQWAVLKYASGTAGQSLMSRGHKLPLGGKSMVSSTIATRHARVALDVGAESVRFDNPLLPDTRSEIALPLSVGKQIVGVLDVQSTQEAAFQEQDVDTLQGMSNSVATALENARLFQETQKSLDEMRTIQRTYVNQTWSDAAQNNEGYEYSSAEVLPPETILSAMDVPLTLREQIIGQLHLEGQQDWTPEERNLVEAVATQAALAMENARLLEESRQMALRERLAAEIIGKVWSSPNTDFILQTAIKELGRALHVDDATIELKVE